MPIHTCLTNGDIEFTTIAWSPDNRCIAVANLDRSVQVIDVSSGQHFAQSGGQKGYIDLITWSPDSKYVAFCICSGNIVQVFSKDFRWPPSVTATFVNRRTDHLGQIDRDKPLTWTSDGKYIAFSCLDGTTQMFDAFSGKAVPSTGNIRSLLYSPNGRYMLSKGTNAIQVLETTSQQVITNFNGHQGRTLTAVWSPDGRYIASSGLDDYTIRVWSAYSGKELFNETFRSAYNSEVPAFLQRNYPIEAIAWSLDGRYFAFSEYKQVYIREMQSETSFIY